VGLDRSIKYMCQSCVEHLEMTGSPERLPSCLLVDHLKSGASTGQGCGACFPAGLSSVLHTIILLYKYLHSLGRHIDKAQLFIFKLVVFFSSYRMYSLMIFS